MKQKAKSPKGRGVPRKDRRGPAPRMFSLVPEEARAAADAVERAFMWDASDEGDAYWRAVWQKLQDYGTEK